MRVRLVILVCDFTKFCCRVIVCEGGDEDEVLDR